MTVQSQNVVGRINFTSAANHLNQMTHFCETASFTSSLTAGTKTLLAATMLLASIAYLHPVVKIKTAANLTSGITSHTVAKNNVAEKLTFSSILYRKTTNLVVEHLVLTSPLVLHMQNTVIGAFNVEDTANPKAVKRTSYGDALVLSSKAQPVLKNSLVEHANFTNTTSFVNRGYGNLAAGINFTSAVLHQNYKNSATTTFNLTSNYTTRISTKPQIKETLVLTDSATYPITNTGWWMNSLTTAMTHFDGLPFTSMAVIKGRVFGMGAAGLYELLGENDNGVDINASVTTGYSTLGANEKKRVVDVGINGTSTDPLTLTVSVDGANAGHYSYTVPRRDTNSPRGNRVTLAKGLNSVYWKFSISNQNGGDFDIDTIDATVSPSISRRV